jgi:hypothetical protein
MGPKGVDTFGSNRFHFYYPVAPIQLEFIQIMLVSLMLSLFLSLSLSMVFGDCEIYDAEGGVRVVGPSVATVHSTVSLSS